MHSLALPPNFWYGGSCAHLLRDGAWTKRAQNPTFTRNAHTDVEKGIRTLMRTCNGRQSKATHRREFRRVRACWKALAKHPAQHSLAQERILAETLFTENMQTFTNTKPPEEKQPDPKMIKISTANGKTLRLGVFNVRGMNFISGRQQLMYLMKKHDVDILALLETHVNYTGKETHGQYSFYFSSTVSD